MVVACILVSSRKIAMKGSGMLKFYRGRSVWRKRQRYPYSYAKYKSGILVDSKGDFSYPRYLERFGKIEHAPDYEHGRIFTHGDSRGE